MPSSRSCSVELTPSTKEMVQECKKRQTSLNKVTAFYRHLVACVGSSSDSNKLRDDLEQIRRKVYELSTGLQTKLALLLTDKSLKEDERTELERLWVIFQSTMELFQQDLGKTHNLTTLFPLNVRKTYLVNTGVAGKTNDVGSKALSVKAMGSNGDECSVAIESLEKHFEQVGKMLHEMEMKVNIPLWAVEPSEEVWPEAASDLGLDDTSSNEMLAASEVTGWRCCYRGCRLSSLVCMVS
ncbi:regulator of G-protein signaling 9-binding protein-like [Protopterus annectens]|uniref:regulator of G-protein signaling 9-binding protein-like n=1 Tax=Protopterus annectens TaxID=7888 RepID=UPI001CFC040C|nr:regulator of G-protein signaling 9-binding protein-like [Protopterus annectens]